MARRRPDALVVPGKADTMNHATGHVSDTLETRPPKRLLIVDDDHDITASLKIGLERRGMEIVTFNDPLKALEELKGEHRYDLIISDISMPNMNGFEFYREIRKNDASTPIAFLTAFEVHQYQFEKMFRDLRPRALFGKPIGIAELATHIDEILDGHEESNSRQRL